MEGMSQVVGSTESLQRTGSAELKEILATPARKDAPTPPSHTPEKVSQDSQEYTPATTVPGDVPTPTEVPTPADMVRMLQDQFDLEDEQEEAEEFLSIDQIYVASSLPCTPTQIEAPAQTIPEPDSEEPKITSPHAQPGDQPGEDKGPEGSEDGPEAEKPVEQDEASDSRMQVGISNAWAPLARKQLTQRQTQELRRIAF